MLTDGHGSSGVCMLSLRFCTYGHVQVNEGMCNMRLLKTELHGPLVSILCCTFLACPTASMGQLVAAESVPDKQAGLKLEPFTWETTCCHHCPRRVLLSNASKCGMPLPLVADCHRLP